MHRVQTHEDTDGAADSSLDGCRVGSSVDEIESKGGALVLVRLGCYEGDEWVMEMGRVACRALESWKDISMMPSWPSSSV